MKSSILALLWLAVAAVASAQVGTDAPLHLSKPAARAELVAAVNVQLGYFRAGDWEHAYGCASKNFQQVMPLDTFVELIGTKYPLVWKNTRAEFAPSRDNGVIAVVPVRVFGERTSEAYNWLLVKEGGAWKVTGVVPQPISGA
ncbi:MAG: hypothetical protein JWM32_1233 [Verrucomicrobia bacterium]|nr:hypothetical protein [Verrucomicrobiota bacterium]